MSWCAVVVLWWGSDDDDHTQKLEDVLPTTQINRLATNVDILIELQHENIN